MIYHLEKIWRCINKFEKLDIPESFKYGYLQQMSLRDFISNSYREVLIKLRIIILI